MVVVTKSQNYFLYTLYRRSRLALDRSREAQLKYCRVHGVAEDIPYRGFYSVLLSVSSAVLRNLSWCRGAGGSCCEMVSYNLLTICPPPITLYL